MEKLSIWTKSARQEAARKYQKRHLKQLFDGALPVFVAATISRAVISLIDAIVGTAGNSTEILATFLYAFFIAHLAGYYIAFNFHPDWVLFGYCFRIGIENAGFAWKQVISLVVIRWLHSAGAAEWAFLAWVIVCLMVIIVVAASTVIEYTWCGVGDVNSPPSVQERAKNLQVFVSEAFALPIAYTLTLIVAALMYVDANSGYLSGVDDDEALSGHGDETSGKCFIVYAVGITGVFALAQYYGIRFVDGAEGGKDGSSSSSDTAPTARKQVVTSLNNLLNTTCGYIVGCAWYTWSVLTFQVLFKSIQSGHILGLCLYATVITVVVVMYLTRASLQEEEKRLSLMHDHSQSNSSDQLFTASSSPGEGKDEGEAASHDRNSLLLCSARLVVGWSWEEFVIACFTAAIPHHGDVVDRAWVSALVKTAVAVAVIFLGAYFEVNYFSGGGNKSHSLSRDMYDGDDSVKSRSSSVSLDEHLLDGSLGARLSTDKNSTLTESLL